MPRNRRPRDREEKSAEIVTAAARLFRGVGYERTSLVNVADAAGVTTTTIYWYFDSKEALLIAVLDHVLAHTLRGIDDQAQKSLVERLLWMVERLDRQAKLVTTVHALATVSPKVKAWHDGFHAVTNEMLAHGLRESGTPEEFVAARTLLGVFAVEGLLMHPLPPEGQRAVLTLAVGALR